MLDYLAVGQNRKSEATDNSPGLPPNARRSPKWRMSSKAAMRQRARAWVIPVLCQEGIHYCLTRVRGRRRIYGTTSGRGIPGAPAARRGEILSIGLTLFCAFRLRLQAAFFQGEVSEQSDPLAARVRLEHPARNGSGSVKNERPVLADEGGGRGAYGMARRSPVGHRAEL